MKNVNKRKDVGKSEMATPQTLYQPQTGPSQSPHNHDGGSALKDFGNITLFDHFKNTTIDEEDTTIYNSPQIKGKKKQLFGRKNGNKTTNNKFLTVTPFEDRGMSALQEKKLTLNIGSNGSHESLKFRASKAEQSYDNLDLVQVDDLGSLNNM